MNEQYFPKNKYISPKFALRRFNSLLKKYPYEDVIRRNEFKVEREVWTAAVFLIGVSSITRKEYWLRPCIEEESPDIHAFSLRKKQEGIYQELLSIEIFDYEEHSNTNLVGAITDKLKNKKYPDHYILLCYVRKEIKGLIPYRIYEEVKKSNPQIGEIWVLFFPIIKGNPKAVIFEAFPDYNLLAYDYKLIAKKSLQIDIVDARRDLSKKTEDIKFEYIGEMKIPLP